MQLAKSTTRAFLLTAVFEKSESVHNLAGISTKHFFNRNVPSVSQIEYSDFHSSKVSFFG